MTYKGKRRRSRRLHLPTEDRAVTDSRGLRPVAQDDDDEESGGEHDGEGDE